MSLTSSDELVDVLDENGKPIGVTTRRRMREERLPHRCVYVLMFNSAGELLIHKRTATKDVYPSFWDVAVGGVLAAGEGFDAGARRELFEEVGIQSPLFPLFPFHYRNQNSEVFAMVYRCISDDPLRMQVEEVEQAEFVSTERVEDLFVERSFCPDGMKVWLEFLASW